ncbi:hypothetical protein EC973_007529 [Apophysomyces ossiformis]|uniref:Regulator of volume decrease after cellular swelling-domain-containing protein n=1 Tax=Apophysomyces ossiformis TaxID=679940 RepID=A0A8H7BP60_9FUNG|nr:hypothetical protein EC973_007529 [Apophysomyces ossiformis]
MTVTLLSSPPNLSDLVVRSTQKDTGLIVLPPLAGIEGPLRGDLYVCESQLYFYSAEHQSGISVEYPDIIIHAISRQDGTPCIYCQLDAGLFFPNQQIPEDEEDALTELKFVPRDPGALEGIYAAMSECAALHPDEEFMAEQAGSDEEWYGNPHDEEELNEDQQAALRRLESVFQPSPNGMDHDHDGQFDHANENDE